MIKSKLLQSHHGINHAFFSRDGGVSEGIYTSLNCSFFSADSKENIIRNRAICAEHIGVSEDHLVTLCQCHSNKVIPITDTKRLPLNEEADALVTAIPGVALGVLTADCAPLLFYAPDVHAIAAAHAGWRGALNGVVENTIQALCDLGAAREAIHCAIGPCIHQKSYEVGPEFIEQFIEKSPDYAGYFDTTNAKDGHGHYDNPRFLSDRLKENGISHIEILPYDTYTNPDMLFSYRRTTHNNEPDYGRHLSTIVLRE